MESIKTYRNNKKLFVIFLFVIFFLFWFSSGVSGELKRVVVIVTMPVATCEAHLKWFVTQLNDLGYKNGSNMDLTIIRANGNRKYAEDELKKYLKDGKPDVVATIATLASQAALKVLKGSDVPIFFFQVSDPVGASLIEKIGVPTGTNVTGRVFNVPGEIRLNLASRLIGQTTSKRPIRFGYIHSTYPSAMGDIKELKEIVKKRTDFIFESYQVMYEKVPDGVPQMLANVKKGIQAISGKVDFWWQPQGPLGEINDYTQLLLKYSKIQVAIGNNQACVKKGALLHITPDLEASGREAAIFVDAILKGADPGEIRVTPPGKFQIGINLTTALKLNIVVPPDMLDLAGDHVYR
jgi:putative tryptophan/tyrosine transport system substrate-binding protein